MQKKTAKNLSKRPMNDASYMIAVLMMLSLGLVMVFSASMDLAGTEAKYGYDELYFIKRQLAYIIIGIVAGGVIYRIPMRYFEKYAVHIFILGIVFLLMLFIPGLGKTINGSTRWINLKLFDFQPSETIKLALILYLANFAVRKANVMHLFKHSFLPVFWVLILIGALLMRQPDFSTFIVIASIAICMMWLAGINVKIFIGLILILFVGGYWFIYSEEYRLARVETLFNGPWAEKDKGGYQVMLSLLAYGKGGLTGVGLGGGWAKIYLPEAYNDFLVSVIAEELGLFGLVMVIGLVTFIVNKGFQIGKQAQHFERAFSALLAYGISVWFAIQSIVHIGVSVNVLPATGVNLPLMSYGGSSMVVTIIAMAIMLRIDHENRCIQKGVYV